MKHESKNKTVKSIIEAWKWLNPTQKHAPKEIKGCANRLTGPMIFSENTKKKKSRKNKQAA